MEACLETRNWEEKLEEKTKVPVQVASFEPRWMWNYPTGQASTTKNRFLAPHGHRIQ
jgi:hypothetical protein